jgi:exopolysaccharide biosynthesis polyprenyl glycosylphosphotransferase
MRDLAVDTRWPNAGSHRPGRARRPAASGISRTSLRLLLVASDLLALALALLVAHAVAPTMPLRAVLEPGAPALLAVTLPALAVGARLSGLYAFDERPAMERMNGYLVLVGTGLCLLVTLALRANQDAREGLLAFVVLAVACVPAGRATTRALAYRFEAHAQTAVIVGAGDVGQLIARKLLRHPEYRVRVIGFVDAPPKEWRADVAGLPLLGGTDKLTSIVRELGVDRVIVAFSTSGHEDTLAAVRPLAWLGVRIDVVTRLFEMIGPGAGLLNVEGVPVVSIAPRRRSVAAWSVKRAIDIALASVGLILAAPLFLWAAWRITRESRGPVFFRQTRLGAGMEEFTMLKFRTMFADADQSSHRAYIAQSMHGRQAPAAGELYKLDRRDVVTPTGRWLRRTSLDELPQLINVLQGKMSLVGPRPCLPYETEHFAPHHFERFRVPPGITGLWQVTARAHASFAEALEMDVAYVRGWSIGLDLSLLLRTPAQVFRQRTATV